MTVALPREAAGLLALEPGPEDLDGEPLGDQPRHPVEVAGGDLDVDAHRVELPDDRQLGVIGAAAPGRGADEVAQLDLGQADPPVDRRGHPAIAQVDLGHRGRRLRPRDVGLGGDDVRLEVGLGLLQAGLVGLDLRRVLLAKRLLALDVFDRGGVPLEQRLFPPLLDLGELERRRPTASCAVATSRALESCAFFRVASACSSLAWASASLALKGSSSMTNRSWPALTSPPSSKWISLRNPRTRARIETSWSARVVPIGSAMIGTVIRRASTTDDHRGRRGRFRPGLRGATRDRERRTGDPQGEPTRRPSARFA